MKTVVPTDPDARAYFIERMLSDTGFFCRHVLGMDTDRDAQGNIRGEEGQGGIRSDGPHQETIRFIDDDSYQHAVLWTPRFTYKSSKVTGFILRKILRHPNIAILLCMHTTRAAEDRVRVIRDILTTNPVILELFGDLRGPVWEGGSFVTSLRTDTTLLTPTLYAASPQKGTAGGRPDLIVFDDIVTEENSKSDLGLRRGREFVENSLSLRGQSTRYLMVATPWHEQDAGHWAIDAGWHKCIHLDVGCDVIRNEDGTVTLEGESRWPNLPTDHLRKYLKGDGGGGMSFELFMSQFKLQVVRGVSSAFKRQHFRPESWRQEFEDLTGYLLCDTAPSGSTSGDLNVLLYIGMDAKNHIKVLDCEIGYWLMYEFCDRYLAMLQRWQSKVNHRSEIWEKGHTYFSYTQHIRVRAKERNIRLNIHAEPRNNSVSSKDHRISGVQIRFQAGEVSIVDTIPLTWNAGTEHRCLWDPESEFDHDTKVWLPGGEFVQQFVRWPNHTKKDIPDTMALVDAMDKATQSRVCFHVKPSRLRQDESVLRKPAATRRDYLPRGSATRFYERYGRS